MPISSATSMGVRMQKLMFKGRILTKKKKKKKKKKKNRHRHTHTHTYMRKSCGPTIQS
jgi:hypothetical protein